MQSCSPQNLELITAWMLRHGRAEPDTTDNSGCAKRLFMLKKVKGKTKSSKTRSRLSPEQETSTGYLERAEVVAGWLHTVTVPAAEKMVKNVRISKS